MEFDFDYEPASWDGEPMPVSTWGIGVIKTILKSGLDEFSEKQIADLLGTRRVRLEQLWKAGLLKKYEATKPSKRPQRIYAPSYEGILYALSGDPEIRDLLQERARRQQPIVQDNRPRGGYSVNNRRVSHRPPTPGRHR